jgi:hypothetical protein
METYRSCSIDFYTEYYLLVDMTKFRNFDVMNDKLNVEIIIGLRT